MSNNSPERESSDIGLTEAEKQPAESPEATTKPQESGPGTVLILGVVCSALFWPAYAGAQWNWSNVTGDGAIIFKLIQFVFAVALSLFAIAFAFGPIIFLAGYVGLFISLFQDQKNPQDKEEKLRTVGLILVVSVVTFFGVRFAVTEAAGQYAFRNSMPSALPELLKACSSAHEDATRHHSSLRPMILPVFREQAKITSWKPEDFTLRLIGDLSDDRQAYYPDTVQTVVVVDWDTRSITLDGKSVEYEVWDSTIIDIQSKTIIGHRQFDIPPESDDLGTRLVGKTPQIAFGEWLNGFALDSSTLSR